MDRLEEIKKKFCVLNDWTITIGLERTLGGTPYTGQCTINSDKRIAVIYSWHTNESEPSDYILHEVLHIALRAALMDRERQELFVQDLCTQFKEKDQETERLRREKEWLLNKMVEKNSYDLFPTREIKRGRIIDDMQQALKEGTDDRNIGLSC